MAFESHPTCYKDSGYCSLTKEERLQVLSTVAGINLLLKLDESLLQYMSVVRKCVEAGEYNGIIETFNKILQDKENIKQFGQKKIKEIFFDIPKTTK